MAVQELPLEIIMEIMLRLPVKSLIRFKCVSKSWFFFITSPSFKRWHLNRGKDSSSNSIIVCSVSDADYKFQSIGEGSKEDIFVESMEVDFPMIRGKLINIKCCCDGMLCLTIGDDTLVLWNPSIRVNKRLPLPPSKLSRVSLEVFGFGYDLSIKDYKVVRLPSIYCDCSQFCSYQVQVLTLRTNLWRKIGDFPSKIILRKMAITVNGGLYWQAGLDVRTQNLILRFDLAEETFREVATPPIEELGKDPFRLGQLKGSLCMYVNCALWVMKEEGELWSKMMIFKQPQIFFNYLQPLYFTKSGKLYLVNLLQDEPVIYDPKRETYKKLDICGSGHWLVQSTVYTESLISPESDSGMKDID